MKPVSKKWSLFWIIFGIVAVFISLWIMYDDYLQKKYLKIYGRIAIIILFISNTFTHIMRFKQNNIDKVDNKILSKKN